MIKYFSFILLIGDEGCYFLPPRFLRKKIAPCFIDKDKTTETWELIKKHPLCPVHILADTRTQNIKTETVPPLSYFDRKKLIKRRLQQAFPKTDFCDVISYSAEKHLLLSLTETSVLTSWLQKIRQLPNPFSGISLLPCELVSLPKELSSDERNNWRMIVLYHQTSGFRQIVTHNNHLIFTRVTPLLPETTSADYLREQLEKDIKATRDYLGRFGLKQSDKIATALILPAHLKKLALQDKSILILSPAETASHIKCDYLTLDQDIYADYLSLLWTSQSMNWKSRLFHPEDREKWKHLIIRYSGWMLTFIVLLFLILQILGTSLSLTQNYYNAFVLESEVTELDKEFKSLRTSFASSPETLGRLREAIEKKRFYTQEIETPEPLLEDIATILNGKAYANQLTWQKENFSLELALANTEKLSRAEMISQIDALAQSLDRELALYKVTIRHYPFPHNEEESITNKSPSKTAPAATFYFEKVTP